MMLDFGSPTEFLLSVLIVVLVVDVIVTLLVQGVRGVRAEIELLRREIRDMKREGK